MAHSNCYSYKTTHTSPSVGEAWSGSVSQVRVNEVIAELTPLEAGSGRVGVQTVVAVGGLGAGGHVVGVGGDATLKKQYNFTDQGNSYIATCSFITSLIYLHS